MVYFPKSSFAADNVKFVRPWVKHVIIKQVDKDTFEVQRESGTGKAPVHVTHRNRMKPYFGPPPPPQAQSEKQRAQEDLQTPEADNKVVYGNVLMREIVRTHPERPLPVAQPLQPQQPEVAAPETWQDRLAKALFEPRSSRSRGTAVEVPLTAKPLEYDAAQVRDIVDQAHRQQQ